MWWCCTWCIRVNTLFVDSTVSCGFEWIAVTVCHPRSRHLFLCILHCRTWVRSTTSLVIILGIAWLVGLFTFHAVMYYIATLFYAFQVSVYYVHVCASMYSCVCGMPTCGASLQCLYFLKHWISEVYNSWVIKERHCECKTVSTAKLFSRLVIYKVQDIAQLS